MAERSTIETSRKIFAMKAAFKMLLSVLAYYIIGKIIISAYNLIASIYLDQCVVASPLNENIFLACITAIGAIITTLNIADGYKGHEKNE